MHGNGNEEFEPSDRPRPVETADGSLTLYSPRYGQTYGSERGALEESRHVFLGNSGLGARLATGMAVDLLEVGFGTGLNFLVSAQEALRHRGTLRYVALERDLVDAPTLADLAHDRFVGELADDLVRWRRSLGDAPAPGPHRFELGATVLELLLGDAVDFPLPAGVFHIVYHDAFSPDANPELWSEEYLRRLAGAMRPGGILVSYTVKGSVRRALAAAGLTVEKLPGPPGGKRESLRATRRA